MVLNAVNLSVDAVVVAERGLDEGGDATEKAREDLGDLESDADVEVPGRALDDAMDRRKLLSEACRELVRERER